MKQKISSVLTATGIVAILAFSSCKKEQTVSRADASLQDLRTAGATTTFDRIDEIMKDLSRDDYSLSFDKPLPSVGITRTAYGADSYLVFADPQDVICPDPIRKIQVKVPIWKRPNFIQPTCPDMSIDIIRLKQVQDLLVKADQNQFGSLRQVKLSNGGGFLASQQYLKQNASLQPDVIDRITTGLNPEGYLLLSAPGSEFTRSFYGYADLDAAAARRGMRMAKVNVMNLFKPTLKGCFDPQILSVIKDRLIKTNPAAYKDLNVTPLQDGFAVLGF